MVYDDSADKYARMIRLMRGPEWRRLHAMLSGASVALDDGRVVLQRQVPWGVPFTFAPTEAEREALVTQVQRAAEEALAILDLHREIASRNVARDALWCLEGYEDLLSRIGDTTATLDWIAARIRELRGQPLTVVPRTD